MSQKIPNSRLEELDCGHFDVYTDAMFEANMAIQEQFLKGVL